MKNNDLPHRVIDSTESIRFFFDESCLGIGKIVAQARADTIFPGHPRSPINPGDPDSVWITNAAEQDWVVVLRDKKIRSRPSEKAALASNPLRVLVLTSAGELNVWNQLRTLIRSWDRIEELLGIEPPWLYSVTKAGLRKRSYPTS